MTLFPLLRVAYKLAEVHWREETRRLSQVRGDPFKSFKTYICYIYHVYYAI